MQKLKETLENMQETGRAQPQIETLIDADFLEQMGDRLVAWADALEKWGLVDYETGIWEEEILDGTSIRTTRV